MHKLFISQRFKKESGGERNKLIQRYSFKNLFHSEQRLMFPAKDSYLISPRHFTTIKGHPSLSNLP